MTERLQNRSISQTPGLAVCGGLILCLFLTRFFFVAESAGQGDTLWIVALWFLVLLMWAVASRRSDPISIDVLDLCVGMLAGGHMISAIVVIATTGDKRSALNLAWEWIGVAVGWFLLRHQCRQSAFRRELLMGLIATGIAVAGLGLYQHYIDFPNLAAKYGPLFDRLRHADSIEASIIRQTLARDDIPIDGPSLILFEKRLRDSREPLGLFALANTFGGFLAVCLILAINVACSGWQNAQRQTARYLAFWIPVIAILGWCLILTKSRTAWVGTATGLALWSFRSGQVKLGTAQLRGMGGSLAVLALMLWGLVQLGGLDRQVLTEAPKSLQYRLQYWSATLPMIRDHFWFGVGLGQFRENYLFYKLAEASEEISDPHNFLLDVAANGGLIAFLGTLGLVAALVLGLRRSSKHRNEVKPVASSPVQTRTIVGYAAAFWMALLLRGADDRILVLLPIAMAVGWMIRRLNGVKIDDSQSLRAGTLSAAIALLVHLLGAGGIGMPAITLLLLALTALAFSETALTIPSELPASWVRTGSVLALGLVLLVSLSITSLRPVMSVQEQLTEGDRLVEKGFPDAADDQYSCAAIADSFSAEPWRRRAELAYRKAASGRFQSNDSFLNAVRLMRECRSRDPLNFQDERRLGDWWLARWRTTHDMKDVQESVSAYQQAEIRYPTNAMLMADHAMALEASRAVHEASSIAEKALGQDTINRERGHVDRFLDDQIRIRMEKLAGTAAKSK